MHVFHRRVGYINLFDETLTFPVEGLQYDSNSTEHISVEKGTENQDAGTHNVLNLSLWVNVISA